MTVLQQPLTFGSALDVAAFSSVGVGPQSRSENQDNFLLIDHAGSASFLAGEQLRGMQVPGWAVGHARVAVLDGMGGHGRGREAAEAVVAGLLDVPPCPTLDMLSSELDGLHARLQEAFCAGTTPDRRPGTTLTLLELPPAGPALLYHVGDSRLYEIGAHKPVPLTVDHVPATVLAMEGIFDEHAWWQQVHGEHRPQIAQAFVLGNTFEHSAGLANGLHPLSSDNLPAFLKNMGDRRALHIARGATYLLATDGFWSCADPHSWVARWPRLLAGQPDAAGKVAALFQTMAASPPLGVHPDNLTAIVLVAK